MADVGIIPAEDGGFRVRPTERLALPGVYYSYAKAEMALEKYRATNRIANKKRLDKRKEKGVLNG